MKKLLFILLCLFGVHGAVKAQVSFGWGTTSKSKSKTSTPGYINVEKKDTKFQEAEAKRKLEEKKAEAQRQVRLQAIKNKAQPQEKGRIRKVLIGSSRQ